MTDKTDDELKAFFNDELMKAAVRIKDAGVPVGMFIGHSYAFIAGALVDAVGTDEAGRTLHTKADEVASGAYDRAAGKADQRS